ncbi:MAG: hypothetical protein NXH83_18230 [Rhodobacteraceae bacterium]|nr:hypothetical protein [Paracoccaceae bacterium]
MIGDTIYDYRGKAALWAALCAFDAVESGNETFVEADAAVLLEGVWDFVRESCLEAEEPLPTQIEAQEILRQMITDWNRERAKSDLG